MSFQLNTRQWNLILKCLIAFESPTIKIDLMLAYLLTRHRQLCMHKHGIDAKHFYDHNMVIDLFRLSVLQQPRVSYNSVNVVCSHYSLNVYCW